MAEHAGDFSILVVCTGNICRSPIAEQLLRARLAGTSVPFRVSSAGTFAVDGMAMTPEAADQSRAYGGVAEGHAARPLTETLVANSQLVLTASREHRAAVVSLFPRSSRYTFTLRQFADLAGVLAENGLSFSDPAEFVAAAAAHRGFVTPSPDPDHDDIEDPYRRSLDVYERSATAIDTAVTAITAGFRSDARGSGRS